MLTPFGKAARKWRIDHDIKQEEMARSLGISCAFLSAVELGRKKLNPQSPIIAKLPPDLQWVVYAEARRYHSDQARKFDDLITKLETEPDRRLARMQAAG